MRVLLCPVGSHGDAHPFVGIGMAMKARGHSVTLIAAEPYQSLAIRHGFEFAQVGTTDEYQSLMHDPMLWHPTKSLRVVFREDLLRKYLPLAYRHIRDRYVPGETVVAAGALSMAARVAHEKLGVPFATVHLQPMGMVSIAHPPRFPGATIPRWFPHWMRRAIFWYADRFIIDSFVAKPLNDFRRTLDLPPITRVWGPWRHSPQLVLGLFPTWFGTAPDWPAELVQTGFIRYDQAEPELTPALARFLDAGDPPLVISLGSAMLQGRAHFDVFVQVCEQLGRRGLILAKSGEQIPTLPASVTQFDYAPFSQVFPRAAAVIHHGGIGTTAQALAAGVPMLINALAFDQPDNGERIAQLGVGRWLAASEFTMQARSREVAGWLAKDEPLAATCDLMERLRGRDVKSAAS
jgi:rhamnosyltransferase subunit B